MLPKTSWYRVPGYPGTGSCCQKLPGTIVGPSCVGSCPVLGYQLPMRPVGTVYYGDAPPNTGTRIQILQRLFFRNNGICIQLHPDTGTGYSCMLQLYPYNCNKHRAAVKRKDPYYNFKIVTRRAEGSKQRVVGTNTTILK